MRCVNCCTSNSIHNSDLYLEESHYSLKCLVCICILNLIWTHLAIQLQYPTYIWLCIYCFWLALPFHLRFIVNLGHILISLFLVTIFLGHATFLHLMCFCLLFSNTCLIKLCYYLFRIIIIRLVIISYCTCIHICYNNTLCNTVSCIYKTHLFCTLLAVSGDKYRNNHTDLYKLNGGLTFRRSTQQLWLATIKII